MNKIFIIAEAGVNHNGDIDLAKKLIDAAADAKVDAIKFQTFKAEKLVSKQALMADYQVKNTNKVESQFEMIKKLELTYGDFTQLKSYAESKNIMFLSTPFDLESIDFLDSLGMRIMKLPSGEITNLPYLRKIGNLNKEVIFSTGMTDLGEVEDALEILVNSGTAREKITVLHCNTEYPTPMEDVNLNAMQTLKEAFKIKVGYSDHTLGIEIPIAAVALGATVIEKHFTLDKNMEGPDHRASLEPGELREMVRAIRNIEIALGNGIKSLSKSEAKNKPIARKSIHLAKDLKKGHFLKEEDLTMKRPGNGISPMMLDLVLGKELNLDLVIDDLLKWEHLK